MESIIYNVSYVFDTLNNLTEWPSRANKTDIANFLISHNNVDRYVTPVMYLIGFPGNVLSFIVWIQKSMRQSSGCYLAALGLVDIWFLTLQLVYELHHVWQVNLLDRPYICEAFPVVFLWLQYLSPMLVFGFTVERYISVCHPFMREILCTTTRAVKVIVVLTLTAFMLCVIQAYFYSYDIATKQCGVRTSVSGTGSLWSIWTWITEMLVFLVIPLAALGFNVRVIGEARRLNRETETRLRIVPRKSSATTFTLLTVSFVLIFTTLPVTITTCVYYSFQQGNQYLTVEQIRNDVVWSRYFNYYMARIVIQEIGLTHYACNVIVYYVTSKLFRREIRRIFFDKLKTSRVVKSCGNRCCPRSNKTKARHGVNYQKHLQSSVNGSTAVTLV